MIRLLGDAVILGVGSGVNVFKLLERESELQEAQPPERLDVEKKKKSDQGN